MISPTRGFVAPLARSRWRFASSSARKGPPTPGASKKPLPSGVSAEYKPTRPRPSQKHQPPKQSETLDTLWRTYWLPLSGAALAAGALGYYIFGIVAATLKDGGPCACQGEHTTPTGRPPALTGENAEQFDKELNLPEWWMGITSLRRKLAERATGHVLELAMGSGRNLEYYTWEPLSEAATSAQQASSNSNTKPTTASKEAMKAVSGITTFTGLDISADMLDVARRRLVKAVPPMKSSAPIVRASTMSDHTGGQLSYLDGHLRLVNSDAHKPLPPPSIPSAKKYDTVVQTFGLCSVSDPVAVLSNLATAVKPDTGRIILLEHGKGWLGIVNGLLDNNAGKHFEKYGCWWNRDIQALVDEATKKTPGLEVVKIETPNIFQMGTLVWVELKVRQGS